MPPSSSSPSNARAASASSIFRAPKAMTWGDFRAAMVDPDPLDVHIMDACLILHAEHTMNASTFSARVTIATLSDTRLEPDLEDLLWSTVNLFHRANERIERELGPLEPVDRAIVERARANGADAGQFQALLEAARS